MKRIALIYVALFLVAACCLPNENVIAQYKAIDGNVEDTTIVYYTFTEHILYVDEVGNEGFSYPYKLIDRGDKKYLAYYDDVWEDWHLEEIERSKDGGIVIKFPDGDILLKKVEKVVDL